MDDREEGHSGVSRTRVRVRVPLHVGPRARARGPSLVCWATACDEFRGFIKETKNTYKVY